MRVSRLWAMSAVTALATSALVAPAAHADGTATASAQLSQEVIDDVKAGTPAPRAVHKFWNRDRLKKAVPVPNPVPAGAERVQPALQEAPESVVAAPSPPAPDASGQARVPVTEYSNVNGKVFFVNGKTGVYSVCSGSAVNSASKRLVVTAAHCVHPGPGGDWHKNWIFIPGYVNGTEPHGTFSSMRMRTFNDWIQYGATGKGYNSDVAFVTTNDSTEGAQVVNKVGGFGITSGGPVAFDATVFGYPQNVNGGETLQSCTGRTEARMIDTYQFTSINGCGFGGGASGGAWLKDYSNDTGLGFVKSVSSFVPGDGSNSYIAGPYFDARVNQLYADAAAG